ncbi:DUF2508 family protein [Sedimentibacter sp. zth1]|uniref:DUF2508 family protein n=1 Tax=Sedimentibacter sp. zth1 TaxID=2816908 RepID=UPI001A912208|nr:DUF2508 family protein [Sedimentibacter sp. zth1]QSX05828.1 DUF2508 family protein [Sedimentibacter sp. zth1]
MFYVEKEKENIIRNFLDSIKKTSSKDVVEIKNAIQKAKQDWAISQQYFDSVSEPDLVDYAIFNQKACEQKYAYLIKQAKQLNLIN